MKRPTSADLNSGRLPRSDQREGDEDEGCEKWIGKEGKGKK
jgi:hypothetical protein